MSCDGRGEEAEMVAVEDAEDGGVGVVRWERFLPRVSVRVLVVESDDSTRQIIAALLRKCSYKVSTASDGLKAWEVLKENSHNIDLVLTEVELPSISGFSLLTLIMDHETFKNIPVIMMSSHDSISMVFKCMSKGAVDFLVKPIRKNELRNLWQHVWRRHISNSRHGDTQGHQDEDSSKKKSENCLSERVASIQEHKEGSSEKGSDAQSSCTRSDMEAESTYNQTMLDKKHHENRDLSLRDNTVAKNGEEHIQSSSGSLVHDGEAEGATPFTVSCNSSEPALKEVETLNEEKPSTEAIDLIGAMDTQRRCNYSTREVASGDKSDSLPYLELSLRRCQHSSYEKPETDDSNTLHRSDYSAFSFYNNRISLPTLLTHEPCGRELNDGGEQNSPGMRAIPFPVPVGGMTFDGLCGGYGAMVQPLYYPQAAHPLWSTNPYAVNPISSHQPDFKDQGHELDDQNPEIITHDPLQEEEVLGDEQKHDMMCDRSTGNATESSNSKANTESGSCDDQFTLVRLNQREAALNKFRLKRKDRCYEKKVRYHSRQRLAEQRPRVKGQFVRHVAALEESQS